MSGSEETKQAEEKRAALLRTMSRQAETLWERLEHAAEASPATGRPELVSKALTVWARVYAGGNQSALLERLGWDGIHPLAAASALTGESDYPEAAAWTRALGQFADQAVGLGIVQRLFTGHRDGH